VTRTVLVDCDTGIDDALALLYLLGDPGVELVGVSCVFGNVSVRQAARNTLGLLERAGRAGVPVAVGADSPLARPFDGGAPFVHGADGVGDVGVGDVAGALGHERGPELIVRLAERHAGRLDLVATGPLTNLALALRLEPRIAGWVRSLTIMGGAASVPGNVTPAAEANVRSDPEAAAAVLAAPWPVMLVPLDVTMEHVIEERERRELLRPEGSLGALAARMLASYFEFYRGVYGRPCAPCHDALAVALAVDDVAPAVAPLVRLEVDDGWGPGRGQTICDLRGRFAGFPPPADANCRVVLRLEEPFVPRLMSRLRSL
jgi:purine nucleosidase